MLAYRAEIEITGAPGARTVPIDEFFTDFFTTALEHGEILTEIRIPIPPTRSGGCYLKVERKVGDYAAAAVAVQLSLSADGSIEQVGIGLTNVAALPTRALMLKMPCEVSSHLMRYLRRQDSLLRMHLAQQMI